MKNLNAVRMENSMANPMNAMFSMNATGTQTNFGGIEFRNLDGYDLPYLVGSNGFVFAPDVCGIPQKMTVYKRQNDSDYVKLQKGSKTTMVSLDSLVAETFFKGGEFFRVQHINGDIHDNRVCNLELSKDKVRKSRKTIYQFGRDGEELGTFADQYEAAVALGVSVSTINNYCLGRHNEKDYILSYFDDFDYATELQNAEKNEIEKDEIYELSTFDFKIGSKNKSFCKRTVHCKDIYICADRKSKRLKLSEGKTPQAVMPKTVEFEDGFVRSAKCEVKGFQSSQKAVVDLDMTRKNNNVVVELPNGGRLSIENLGYLFESQWELLLFAESLISLYFEICKRTGNETITEIVIGQFSSEK